VEWLIALKIVNVVRHLSKQHRLSTEDFMDSLTTIQNSALTAAQKQSLEMFHRAFSDRNPNLLDTALTLDWQDIPLAPGQSPGPEGLKQLMPMFFTAFPDMQIVIDDVIAQPDRAGVRARIVGTHNGEIFGLLPTGKPVSIVLHEFYRFDGDRISHTWHLEDWFGMIQQIGAWPPPQH
jgi:predicted ester cyclase